jgi:hypothetical protein
MHDRIGRTVVMVGALLKRGWRGAVGLIAAYALVLQAFLVFSMASQAAAQDPASFAGNFFVLCTAHDAADAQPAEGAPPPPKAHCPICTQAGSPAATLPGPAALPGLQPISAGRTAFVSVAACISFHQARAGLSRAPPRNV